MTDMSQSENQGIEIHDHQCICTLAALVERWTELEDLKEMRSMFQLVMDNIPLSIFWKDRHGVYIGCNTMFAHDAGKITPAEIIGKTDYDLIWKKEESDFYISCDRRVMDTGIAEYHIIEPQLRQGMKRAWLDTSKIPLRDKTGQIIGVLGMYEDITARIKLEQQHEDFAAALTHDLKGPLIGTNKVLDFLLANHFGELNREQRHVIEGIKQSNFKLLHLIQNLLDLYKFGSGGIDMQFETVDLNALIASASEPFKLLAATKNITLELSLLPLPVEAEVNESAIERLLQNLLDNAIKFTPPGGKITCSLTSDNDTCTIAVRDNGSGIEEEEEREHLFHRFWQGRPGKKYTQGTGLGLHVCKQIVETHHGSIECISQPLQGTEFLIVLPRHGQKEHCHVGAN
jgi:PAS domain S-box-containing protein